MPRSPTTLVMEERPRPESRTTHIHKRGEFLQPGEAVEPGVPAFLPPLAPGAPRDRLGLARWLVSADNPLTARVQVNGAWQALFGRGLVATLDDFGTRSGPPTHPELLDWLATEFVRLGWSQKALHRLIVTSATYRQQSKSSKEQIARDPLNELLGAGAAVPARCRGGARHRPLRQRPVEPEDRRPERLSTPAPDGVTGVSPTGWPHGPTSRALRAVSPRPLHLHQARGAVRGVRDVRHADLRDHFLHPAAEPVEHAAPGPGAAQRPGLTRGLEGPGRSGAPASRVPRPRRASATPSASCTSSASPNPRRSG